MSFRSPTYKRSFIAAVLAIAMTLPALPANGAGGAASLEQTRRQIAEIKHRIAAHKGQAAKIEHEVNALQSQIDALNRQIAGGEHDISVLESDIRSAQTQIGELEVQYDAAARASNDRARRIYKVGPTEALSSLISAKSLGEFARLQVLWEATSKMDGKVMLKASLVKAELTERKSDLEKIRADLDLQRQWLRQRRQLIASAKGEKDRALASVQHEISDEMKELKALEASSRVITGQIRSQLSRGTGAVSRSGFIWPIRGQVTSGYGRRWGGFHPGIDIDGNTGDPIRASKAGTISGITCGSGYGICSIIDHGGGVATLYAHMTRKAIGGGHVNQGDVIGYVGCTGSCTGSHLHFEVRVNGSPQNPRNFLP